MRVRNRSIFLFKELLLYAAQLLINNTVVFKNGTTGRVAVVGSGNTAFRKAIKAIEQSAKYFVTLQSRYCDWNKWLK